MYLSISADDLASYSASTRNEILGKLKGGTATGAPDHSLLLNGNDELYEGIDLEDVAELTPKQMQKWMERASEKTKDGLRLFAETPVVRARELIEAGVDNVPHFQSRTTIRTRTVTDDPDAFLLGWDDWEIVSKGEGRYAVTPITHQSLRKYFKLD